MSLLSMTLRLVIITFGEIVLIVCMGFSHGLLLNAGGSLTKQPSVYISRYTGAGNPSKSKDKSSPATLKLG